MTKSKPLRRYGALLIICAAAVAICIFINHMVMHEQALILSEVCPHNTAVIYDKFGSYSDYIELYNNSDNAISLKGYYLSDDQDNLKLYTIPDVSIDAKGYLLLWAASATEDNELILKESDLYCGFSLSDGDTLYLSNPDGLVLDKVRLSEHLDSDISYSYTKNATWEATTPTPGTQNADGIIPAAAVSLAEPVFSNEAGFYKEGFELTLSTGGIISNDAITDAAANDNEYPLGAANDNGNPLKAANDNRGYTTGNIEQNITIYYTLDGSDPRMGGTEYTGSITISNVSDNPNRYANIQDISIHGGYYIPDENTPIDKCVIVRAVCKDENSGTYGKIISKSYFVGYDVNPAYKDIAVVSLISDPDNIFGYEDGIYVTGKVYDDNREDMNNAEGFNMNKPFANYFMSGEGWRRDTHIELFGTDRTLIAEEDIKLGIQGNYSTNHNQKSFALFKTDETNAGENHDSTGILDGIISSESTSLSLRAGGNKDWRSTKIRDTFAQDLVRERSVGSLRSMPCQVFLDGEYWGYYNLEERVDPGYVTANYGLDADDVVLLKYGHVLAGDESDLEEYAALVDYAATHDLSVAKDYEYMCEHIDIQNYIEYNCYEIYVGNTDSVDCNYAYWRSKEITGEPYCDGKWRWILYDTDDSSGVVEDDMSEAWVDHFTAGHWAVNPLDDTLFKNLIENQTFRAQFAATFLEMADGDFNTEMVLGKLEEIEELYEQPITHSMKRFLGEDYTESDYHTEMEKLKEFYKNRRDYIVEYMYQDLLRPLSQKYENDYAT